MKICGREGCAALERRVGQRFHDDGALYGPLARRAIPGAVPHYRLVMLLRATATAESPAACRWPTRRGCGRCWTPRGGGVWSRVRDSAGRRLDRSPPGSRRCTPRRLTRTTPAWRSRRSGSRGARPRRRMPRRMATYGGLPRPLLAGVPAVRCCSAWCWCSCGSGGASGASSGTSSWPFPRARRSVSVSAAGRCGRRADEEIHSLRCGRGAAGADRCRARRAPAPALRDERLRRLPQRPAAGHGRRLQRDRLRAVPRQRHRGRRTRPTSCRCTAT